MTTIRERVQGDLPACVAVLRHVHAADGYPSNWPADAAGWLTPPGLLGAWVAEQPAGQAGTTGASVIVGHVALVTADAPADGAEVVRLFTAPGARGTGAGRALLDAVAAATCHRLALEVVEDAAAVTFYERQGWRRTARSRAAWTDATGAHPWLAHLVRPVHPDIATV